MPAQLQGTRQGLKKKSGELYITEEDKATSSCIDFSCKKMMLLMALAVAIVVVIVAATVVTGGAALIAIGAIAGAAGAAIGAVAGALICGQKAAALRSWSSNKPDMIVQGSKVITGGHVMTCKAGGVITFAPQIKSWSQAYALGASNYISGIMEGMMAGACVGMAGAAVVGGAGAMAGGAGVRGLGQAALQFAKSAPGNILKNIGASFGYSGGFSFSSVGTALGLRGLTAAQSGLAHYGQSGESGWGAAGMGVFGMEIGMAESAKNVYTGQAGWQDIAGFALMLSPVHKVTQKPKTGSKASIPEAESAKPATDAESVKTDNGEGQNSTRNDDATKADDADTKVKANTSNSKNTMSVNEGNAYADGIGGARYGERRISNDLYTELRDQTPTQEIRDLMNEDIQLPMPDPVLPGLEITKNLHADHIVSMDKITSMEGFDTLTKEQQLAVLNNKENFVGLSESANCSKGSKSYNDWTRHKSKGIDVDPEFRQKMITRENALEGILQKQIDDFNILNGNNS